MSQRLGSLPPLPWAPREIRQGVEGGSVSEWAYLLLLITVKHQLSPWIEFHKHHFPSISNPQEVES